MPLNARDYERNAEECLRLAKEMRNPEHQKAMLDMAGVWQKLAREVSNRERQSSEGQS
ncbi:MAG TPA: hypothetical protein VNT79_03855 [Phycisphaerae bacterium]|nr:hypothetical protein [Phycisphaerae bacterium]